jgi:site-specific DNA recombinase
MLGSTTIYCRVSSSMQEDGASLDEQERFCREYAARHNLTVAAVVHETEDGEEIDRPKLKQLLALGKRGEASSVIVWKQDRLGRGNKAHEVVFYMCELAGLEPLCVIEPYGDSSVDMMTRGIRGIVSGEEKKNIRLRTQMGRQARARSGKLIPGPRPLYGYRYVDAGSGRGQTKVAYEPNPDTAPIVRRIFRELNAGKSLRKIACGLNDDGVPTPWRAKQWIFSSIRLLVVHPAYCGDGCAYGSAKRKRTKGPGGERQYVRVAREDEERIALPEGTIPALISRDEWLAAQESTKRNRREATRHNRDPEAFLLRAGFVRCGQCSRAAHAVWKPPKKGSKQTARPNYVVFRNTADATHAQCASTTISAERLDAAVWARIESVLLDEAVIRREVAKLRSADPTLDEERGIDKALGQVKQKQEKAARAITLLDDDAAEPLVGQLALLGKQRSELERELTNIARRRAMWQQQQLVLDQIAAWRSRVAANLARLTYDLKRDILRAMDVRVTLWPAGHEPRYVIDAGIPLDDADLSGEGGMVSETTRAVARNTTIEDGIVSSTTA